MARRRLALTVALLVLLTGCLAGLDEGATDDEGTDGGEQDDEMEAAQEAFDVTGEGCEELVVWATVPAEDARSVVPNGYDILADDSGFAEAWAALKVCPEGTMDGESIGERAQGNAGVLIEDPTGEDEPGELHFYMPWWITSRADVDERLQAQGWTSEHEPDVSLVMDLTAGVGSVDAEIPWSDGAYGMSGQVAPAAHAEEYVVVAWHEGEHGTLQMGEVLTLTEHSYGPATITVEEGSPAADLFGTERSGEALSFAFDGEWSVGPPG